MSYEAEVNRRFVDRVLKQLHSQVEAIEDPQKRARAHYVYLELHDLLTKKG